MGDTVQQPAAGKIGQPSLGSVEADGEPDLGIDEHRPIAPAPKSGPQGRKSHLQGCLCQDADTPGDDFAW